MSFHNAKRETLLTPLHRTACPARSAWACAHHPLEVPFTVPSSVPQLEEPVSGRRQDGGVAGAGEDGRPRTADKIRRGFQRERGIDGGPRDHDVRAGPAEVQPGREEWDAVRAGTAE